MVLPPGEFKPSPVYSESHSHDASCNRFPVTLMTKKHGYKQGYKVTNIVAVQTQAAINIISPAVAKVRLNPLESRGNHSAISNNIKLVHCPLTGGLLHLVQRGGDWAGPHPAQAPPRWTKM